MRYDYAMFAVRNHRSLLRLFALTACLLLSQLLLLAHATEHALHTQDDDAACILCLEASPTGAGLLPSLPTLIERTATVETPTTAPARSFSPFSCIPLARAPPPRS